jgi:hypothetical protein
LAAAPQHCHVRTGTRGASRLLHGRWHVGVGAESQCAGLGFRDAGADEVDIEAGAEASGKGGHGGADHVVDVAAVHERADFVVGSARQFEHVGVIVSHTFGIGRNEHDLAAVPDHRVGRVEAFDRLPVVSLGGSCVDDDDVGACG